MQTSLQSVFAIPTLFLAWESSEIEKRLRMTCANWCIKQPRKSELFFRHNFLCLQYTLSRSLPSVTSHYTMAVITCYRKLKNRQQRLPAISQRRLNLNLKLFFLSCMMYATITINFEHIRIFDFCVAFTPKIALYRLTHVH